MAVARLLEALTLLTTLADLSLATGTQHSDPYGLVRGRCSYPCECGGRIPSSDAVAEVVPAPQCPSGVNVVRDGCGCCPICAGQEGEPCDLVRLCDPAKALDCLYLRPADASGLCSLRRGRGCVVSESGKRFADGESFKLDCRTQCSCQNGTYGCVSLCPHENVRPSPLCRNPQLVHIRGACCRDWLCESQLWKQGGAEPKCVRYSSPWSECSRSCGAGTSTRLTNDNAACQMRNETRLCFVRSCISDIPETAANNRTANDHHRVRSVRRRHVCRATVKSGSATQLEEPWSSCRSVRAFRPKVCASCAGQCCRPKLTTTLRVPFLCPRDTDAVVLKEVMWIVKCVCTDGQTC